VNRLRRVGLAFLGAIAVAGAILVTHAGSGELDTAPRNRLGGRSRSRIATGGWDAALRLLSPPGAGYDSTNVSLTTGSGGAVTVTSATPRQYCPDSSGALRSLAANKPCVVDGNVGAGSLKVRSQVDQELTAPDDFTNAAWAKGNVTVTANAATAPDGTLTADQLTTSNALGSTLQQEAVVAATSATCSVYAKQGSGPNEANSFLIRNTTTATNLVGGTLNYATGVWTYSVGSAGVVVTAIPNGWYRIAYSATSGITSGNTIRCYVGFSGVATAGLSLFAWGGNLTPTATANDYCAASATTCSAETVTVPFPATVTNAVGCAKWCFTPTFTGGNPLTSTFFLAANSASARLGYLPTGSQSCSAFDGTNTISAAGALTAGARQCCLTQWDGTGGVVTNLTTGLVGTKNAAFAYPAFGAFLEFGERSGLSQGEYTIDSVKLSNRVNGCN
jgi:hypothetical protein